MVAAVQQLFLPEGATTAASAAAAATATVRAVACCPRHMGDSQSAADFDHLKQDLVLAVDNVRSSIYLAKMYIGVRLDLLSHLNNSTNFFIGIDEKFFQIF